MAQRRLRVAVIFGGRSEEHEVSRTSAAAVIGALDPKRYEVVPVAITREGRWLPPKPSAGLLPKAGAAVATPPEAGVLQRFAGAGGDLDVIVPLVHGPFGEDGTIQGFLELADLPYVGSGVLASAVGMDKAVAKRLFAAHGLPQVESELVHRHQLLHDPAAVERRALDTIGLPCFVKPSALGSSVGVTKVKRAEDLLPALQLAARYDRKLLVECAVDAREVECGVLGNDDPQVSLVGEIFYDNEFYDYDAKYTEGKMKLVVPAALSEAQTAEVRRCARAAFLALDAAGMARIDFFVDRQDGAVYLNEVNTIPGFTSTSVYSRLWEASGVGYQELLDRLIQLALERHRDRGASA
jgi:D-alanine-D-alanine ligase